MIFIIIYNCCKIENDTILYYIGDNYGDYNCGRCA